MEFAGREQLQLGKTGWILGDLPNLLAGALDLEVYACPACGKIEFFIPSEEELPQRKCPVCGRQHDFDYPKCPHCGHRYP